MNKYFRIHKSHLGQDHKVQSKKNTNNGIKIL